MKLLIFVSIAVFSATIVFGQEKSITVEPFFTGEAQPTKIKLPLPEYPKDARKAGLGGRVTVGIVVDETGEVSSVTDAIGPYPVCQSVTEPKVLALRAAAAKAAKKATFQPIPVKTSGRVAYVFTPIGYKPKSGGISSARVDGESSQSQRMRLGEATKPGTTDSNVKDTATGGTGSIVGLATDVAVKSEDKNKSGILPPDNGAGESKTVSGGVLNGKALSLARPSYPAAAKAIRAGGAVSVQVLIQEDGNMYSAQAISGHPLLRLSSEIAACSSKFVPTLLSGEPVKVSGIITYNYVP